MDHLFDAQAKRLREAQAAKERIQAQALVAKYNERIKQCILELYAAKGAQIGQLIAIADAIPTCSDLATLEHFKATSARLYAECERYCVETFKAASELRIFYNWNDSRKIEFPPWEIDVVQEWCDYWQSGMLFGASTRGKSGKCPTRHAQVIGLYTEYKSREIHVSIWETVSKCREWRKRYDLGHLDALADHLGAK